MADMNPPAIPNPSTPGKGWASIRPLAVDIDGVDFGYPRQAKPLFSDLHLKIAAGERFGLFGPNGAGKTSLMNLMTGLYAPQKGSVRIVGSFGFVPQDLSFYEELSAMQNLAFFGAWAGLHSRAIRERSAELLEIMGLTEFRHQKVQQFSGGMKRRLNLAIGMIDRPAILFLDEPTVGVDVQTGFSIVSYLKQLNQAGTTLVYTSHQLKEAEDLCDRIALIDEGKIIAHDDLTALLLAHREGGLEGLFLKLTGKDFRN
jgi:ABC-2 type transport system ATP-binding protein